MPVYSATDIIGKHLIAKKNLVAFWDYPNNKKSMFAIRTGIDTGAPITYVVDDKKNVWWQYAIIDNISRKERNYYIMHQLGNFDEQALANQNVLSDEEKQKLNEKHGFDYYLKNYVIPIVIGTAVVKIVAVAIQSHNKN